jgi:hypothetical protein
MSAPTLDVFSFRESIVNEYKHFATSFTTIHANDIREQVEAIYAQNRYWPEPLIQINPSYKRSTDISKLVDHNILDPRCSEIFQSKGSPLSLYKHQEQAIALAASGESFVVTTGTGSGKSLCFFIPIVNHVLKSRRQAGSQKTTAIIVYPMNALANSQLEELGKFVSNVQGEKPVTWARYTGQEDNEERRSIAENPPDILLTNFMMLELLMTRQEQVDRRVIQNCMGLRFLVLDELHTYRGRQGADVAMLARRVRERLRPDNLLCIGTSATMASEGSIQEKSQVVARVASKLFASPISESSVVVETLERITEPTSDADSVRAALGPSIDRGISSNISDTALRKHPLAIWVETRLGVTFSKLDQRWVRAKPMTVTEAVSALSADSGRPLEACRDALRQLLLTSSVAEKDRTSNSQGSESRFFAFKLHQFISGAGHAFSTLERPGSRTVIVDGQQFLPEHPDKRLYPVHFCRECGHEYHPVRLVQEEGHRYFLGRDIDDAPPTKNDDTFDQSAESAESDGELFGFLTPHALDDLEFSFDDRTDQYPETWLEFDAAGDARLKPYYRSARAQRFHVAPNGCVGAGIPFWFLPGKFRLCLRCGTTVGGASRDRTRLASLSAEGRSSATTVLVASALRWMHGIDSGMTSAIKRFDDAFDRWRGLFAAAEDQRDSARRTMDDYSAPYHEKRAAQSRHAQAIDQLNLLQRGTNTLSSDFYTYRYLATEGFLPGYNFPRLPLMAYIPSSRDGRGRQTYLQRPRFLALSEFGPRSLVYHEGRAYRVVKALLSLGQQDSSVSDVQLPTKAVRICTHCGAGHFDDSASMCRACGSSLGTAELVRNVYRIENVATQPAERITANDEERQRQGFELQTTFEWATRDNQLDVRRVVVDDTNGEVARIAYGAGATVTRLNKGLRRRADKKVLGFRIDPVSGYWAKNEDEDEETVDPSASPRQWIVPSVQDRKNALLFEPVGDSFAITTLATVQHAILRGLEAVFQLEEGEVLAEPMPTRENRCAFLLYEATEGGAGVLNRMVAEEAILAAVARKALQIMHFAIGDAEPLPDDASALLDQPDLPCVAACYRCLMSYYNQPDHEIIDRRDPAAREILLRLGHSTARCIHDNSQVDILPPSDSTKALWFAEAARRGLPAVDPVPMGDNGHEVSLVWRRYYVAAALDEIEIANAKNLEELGFEVVPFCDPATWDEAFARLADALGRKQ